MSQSHYEIEDIQHLIRSEKRLRAILESEPECVKTLDQQGRLIDMNPAGLRMIEVNSLTEVIGRDVTEVIVEEYRDDYLNSLRRVFRGETVKQRYEIIGFKGTRRWMEQVAVPLRDPADHHKIVEMLAVTREITDHVRAIEELEREKARAEAANIAKSKFLANMSHEVRTPMNGVLGMLQLVMDEPLSDTQRGRLEIAMSSAESLLKILNDILDFSKIEQGALSIDRAPMAPVQIVNDVVTLLRPKAEEKKIEITAEIDPAVPETCLGDQARIRQILMNLAYNAIKFTVSGSVTVRLGFGPEGAPAGALRVEVADTGIGIPSDKLDSVFERFSQIDSSKTRNFEGAGLGLSIASRLVEKMGGKIGVESKVGTGSTFWFTLPTEVICKYVQSVEEYTDNKSQNTPLRILVAEDQEVNQLVIKSFLEREGHDVTLVAHGHDAVTAHRQVGFDIILMDIQMPVMDGETAAKEIRAMYGKHGKVPIIALTAHAMTGDRESFLASGMTDYLAKPVRSETLMMAIESAMFTATPVQECFSSHSKVSSAANG